MLNRIQRKINKTESCWLWTGSCFASGYGQVKFQRRNRRVHRLVYELLVGPIPDGMTLDHLCKIKNCVNPAHLEVVTGKENTLRGTAPSAINARKTHCPQGHAFSEYGYISIGARNCRLCKREQCLKSARKRRAKS